MKVFISQPMHGKKVREVLKERHDLEIIIRRQYPDAEFVENYFHRDVPSDAERLWHLGESIKLLDKVDAIYFCDGWEKANGCIIEHNIALLYKIKILHE